MHERGHNAKSVKQPRMRGQRHSTREAGGDGGRGRGHCTVCRGETRMWWRALQHTRSMHSFRRHETIGETASTNSETLRSGTAQHNKVILFGILTLFCLILHPWIPQSQQKEKRNKQRGNKWLREQGSMLNEDGVHSAGPWQWITPTLRPLER